MLLKSLLCEGKEHMKFKYYLKPIPQKIDVMTSHITSCMCLHMCISKVGCLMNQLVLYTCNIKNLPLTNVGTLTKFKRWWQKLLVVDEI